MGCRCEMFLSGGKGEGMSTVEERVDGSEKLRGVLAQWTGLDGVRDALRRGESASVEGVWGAAAAMVAAQLAREATGPVFVVSPYLDDLDALVGEMELFAGREVLEFSAWETSSDLENSHPTDRIFADRLRVIKALHSSRFAPVNQTPPASGTPVAKRQLSGPLGKALQAEKSDAPPAITPPLVVASIISLLQPVPNRETIDACTRTLRVGSEAPPERLSAWLVEHGLKHMTAVELPGEFSLHGGILDLFASDWDQPVRLEFFGDKIDSIRQFDVATQRSLQTLPAVEVTILPADVPLDRHACSHLPPGSWLVLLEPGELEAQGRRWLNMLDRRKGLFTVESTLKRLMEFPQVTVSQLGSGTWDTVCNLRTESVERYRHDMQDPATALRQAPAEDEVFVVCENSVELDQLRELLLHCPPAHNGRLHFALGSLRTGVRLVDPHVTILSDTQLLQRRQAPRTPHRAMGRAIDSFLELKEGDYVVHLSHGIGLYLGMQLLEKDSQLEEHLQLEFAEGTKIFVPVSKIDLVQKYIGGAKHRRKLSKIGGRLWGRKKEQAEAAVIDMASQMLTMQAARRSQPGIKFEADRLWQKQFDASFPYTETPDQLTGIAAIKQDMEQPRPMDRLVCGDVGYGKTELAMRAAFKAVDSGFQVAILVPTTILAEQHFRVFTQRMSGFPVQLGVLSRFRSKKEQQQLVAGLAEGSIDIVIGTHRLVQPDLKFAHLGLVVIDEEQRFGVEEKEYLKSLGETVDVLTLSATPIPRTLHMSLLGIRDISNLETPPADRLAVETRVVRFDPEHIRIGIERELGRGGQVYFIHNKVHDIHDIAQRLKEIVPQARIGIGHGQLPERQLEQVMLDFVDHKFDIMLATTIVESGLDIPNANTIFINQADHYGLADLHQLRGRVGRDRYRAHCYLLVDRGKSLSSTASKRLKAIEEFCSMGAGFAIAMRDLEIRGAGNLLGTQQSGHIAAIGYELHPAGTGRASPARLAASQTGGSSSGPARRSLSATKLYSRHAFEGRCLSTDDPRDQRRGTQRFDF